MAAHLPIRTSLLTAVLLGLFVFGCGTCNLPPQLTSISPTSVIAGSGQVILALYGNHFVRGALVSFNGVFFPTTFVNSGQLSVLIPASEVASPGTVAVFVFNPPGSTTSVFGFNNINGCGGPSNAVLFTVKS